MMIYLWCLIDVECKQAKEIFSHSVGRKNSDGDASDDRQITYKLWTIAVMIFDSMRETLLPTAWV